MRNYIDEATANVSLHEGPRAIEKLFLECYATPEISTKELARRTLLPVPVAAAIKKELIKMGALKQLNGVCCTFEGKQYIESQRGFGGLDMALYKKIMAANAEWLPELNESLALLTELFRLRPSVNVQIDQSKCTPETSLRRALLCVKEHTLIGKQILCVGDDDLVSVSLGFLLRRLFPNSMSPKATITVVDIDDRFLRYIDEVAVRERLPIQCCHADLREPLPKNLYGQFDCIITDPPYTSPGLILFLSRGISALKPMIGLPIFLSFAHKAPDFTLAMQREFIHMELMISGVIPSFNEYEGAEMIGNRGQMIILKTTERTEPKIVDTFADSLYTGEVKRTLRTYCCKRCKEIVLVGCKSRFTTVEDLKSHGCLRCTNNTFDLIDKKIF